MTLRHMQDVDEALADAAKRYAFVLVPGLYDSGAEHWQSLWQQRHDFWHRMTQRNWMTADIEMWIGSLRRVLAPLNRPAILVGHSFGALAACCITADRTHDIAGLMLVAPAEPMRFEADHRVPDARLGVPSITVASHNDPVMSFPRARYWSDVWGSELIDIGDAGHINCEAGFGPWPYGLQALLALVDRIDAMRAPEATAPYPSSGTAATVPTGN